MVGPFPAHDWSGYVDYKVKRQYNTNRNILVAAGVAWAAGSHALDRRGVAHGDYQVNLGVAATCCTVSASGLTINQAPSANVTGPSMTSGTDYAAQAGTPWSFSGTKTTTSTQVQITALADLVVKAIRLASVVAIAAIEAE